MRRLILGFILAFFGLGSGPAFATADEANSIAACEARLQSGIGINLERALDRTLIKLRDVKRMIDSSEPYDPFASLAETVENAHFKEFFAAVAQNVRWNIVVGEARKVYQKRTATKEIEEAAAEATQGVLYPEFMQTIELPTSSVEWNIADDGRVYFYAQFLKQVYRMAKTGYEPVFTVPDGIDARKMFVREGRPVVYGFKIIQQPGGWKDFFVSQPKFVMVEFDVISGAAKDVSEPFDLERDKGYRLAKIRGELEYGASLPMREQFQRVRASVPNLHRLEDNWSWLIGAHDRIQEEWADAEGHALVAASSYRTWGERNFVVWDYSGSRMPRVRRVVESKGDLKLKFFEIKGALHLWVDRHGGASEVLLPLDQDSTPVEFDLSRFKDEHFEVLVGRNQVYLIGHKGKQFNVLRLFGSARGEQ